MKAIRLAFSLLMMPRLAARLILVPVAVAGGALFVQLWLLSLQPRLPTPASSGNGGSVDLPRQFAYGAGQRRPTIVRCNWSSNRAGAKSGGIEFPPGKACLVTEHDVAIVGSEPDGEQYAELIARLDGSFEKVHFCEESCAVGAGVVIRSDRRTPETTISGFSNLLMLKAALVDPPLAATRTRYMLPGSKSLLLPGLDRPIVLTGIEQQIARLLSLIMLVVCCVWLSLRAHRRVLDYFASSGSLLPLAASAGPHTLYRALWAISAVRLFTFLALSAPLALMVGLPRTLGGPLADSWDSYSGVVTYIWLVAVTASLVLTTLCASVADLQRRMLAAVLWKAFPLLVVALGTFGWICTMLSATHEMVILRHFIVATPILGLGPLVIASIVAPPTVLLALHAVFAIVAAVLLARRNARWFAGHLEDS